MTFTQSKAFYLNYCQHFPEGGLINPACQLGIKFEDVRDGQNYPCLIDHGCTHHCHSFKPRTEVEAEEYARQSEAAVKQFFDRLTSNKCPHCGVAVEEKVQVGRCVYAKPCNHRMYQGKV